MSVREDVREYWIIAGPWNGHGDRMALKNGSVSGCSPKWPPAPFYWRADAIDAMRLLKESNKGAVEDYQLRIRKVRSVRRLKTREDSDAAKAKAGIEAIADIIDKYDAVGRDGIPLIGGQWRA